MNRKLLFFDIDGTLITTDGRRYLPESAKQAIRAAKKNGHMAFINTGRVMVNVDDFIREVGFDGYVCGCGTYVAVEEKVYLHHTPAQARCYEIAQKCRECGMMALFEHADLTAFDKEVRGREHREILDYFISMGRKLVDDITSPEFIFDKFTAWYYDGNERVEEFLQFIAPDFTPIKREGNFYECVPTGYSKATGMQYVMDMLSTKPQDCYVFGDSNNDLEMLNLVPGSVAMGVCTPEVKAATSYQTDTVENDGIKKALEHFDLI